MCIDHSRTSDAPVGRGQGYPACVPTTARIARDDACEKQRAPPRDTAEGLDGAPNLYLSESVAAKTIRRLIIIRNRSFGRAYFKDMVVAYLRTYHEAKRAEIEKLLLDKVSDALNKEQKRQFIKDLLQEMRKEGTIRTIGITRARNGCSLMILKMGMIENPVWRGLVD